MAKLEHVIKAELDPLRPVQEALAVLEALIRLNADQEQAILQGVADAIAQRLRLKGGTDSGEQVR